MQINWRIVNTTAELLEATQGWEGPYACDTETYGKAWGPGDRRLLGVSLSPSNSDAKVQGIYVPVWVYSQDGRWNGPGLHNRDLLERLQVFLSTAHLVGHNFTYDKRWINLGLEGVETGWVADTRIMWHLASAPAGPRSYGLKDAQTELLGWAEANDKLLELQVKSRGGSLKNGDHYLADLELLAEYACLDTFATIEVYKKLKPWFDTHSYWPLLRDIMAYNELLEANTYLGVKVDREGLQKANKRILGAKAGASKRFHKELKLVIGELEADWRDRRLAAYKREYNKTKYLNEPERWERFNLNSDAHKRELFYGKLRFPVLSKTEGGKPSVSADDIKLNKHVAVEAYLKYEKSNTLSTNFGSPWLESSEADGRLHPGFNVAGTVSYRLSGFKPYLLNAPFDEKILLKNLHIEDGHVGVHADLAAIEPTITAHYSEDPSLLKVFRDGLGDIYLDLALELFPFDKELQSGYNPQAPVTKEVKETFAKQRKVAKVIQLAVQYTGTGLTVAKNLTKQGIPTTREQADGYVRAYWRKFKKVAEFNYRLREINRVQGHLRNVIGRIIRVPDPEYKDLSNRFIQSSAHDVLMLWVLDIYKQCKEKGIDIKPVLLDCHDSTSNQVPAAQAQALKDVYISSLQEINKRLELCVGIKCEIKTFKTLAGLKTEEE